MMNPIKFIVGKTPEATIKDGLADSTNETACYKAADGTLVSTNCSGDKECQIQLAQLAESDTKNIKLEKIKFSDFVVQSKNDESNSAIVGPITFQCKGATATLYNSSGETRFTLQNAAVTSFDNAYLQVTSCGIGDFSNLKHDVTADISITKISAQIYEIGTTSSTYEDFMYNSDSDKFIDANGLNITITDDGTISSQDAENNGYGIHANADKKLYCSVAFSLKS